MALRPAIIAPWIVALACAPVVAAIFGFVYLLLFDRSKLQSEDFQLRQRALEMIEQKGDPKAIEATVVEVIANPDPLPQLPKAHGEVSP